MEIRIIGGSHAAIACATRAREEYPNARIVIYEKNGKLQVQVSHPDKPVSACCN